MRGYAGRWWRWQTNTLRASSTRATHTIVSQVDAMKQMVNAFSEYARVPELQLAPLALNQLVAEVADD